MSNHRETVLVAVVAGFIALFASEVLRRMSYQRDKKKLGPIPKSMFGRTLLQEEFALKASYAYCNCGSFGQVPQRIILEQLRIMQKREADPDGWYRFGNEKSLYLKSVKQLADFVGANPDNLVLVENASTGTNTALRSIHLAAGDKILVTSDTYEAVLKNVKVLLDEIPGLEKVQLELTFPIQSEQDIIVQYEKVISANPGIKVAILDHIASQSAVRMPLKPLIDLCHSKGILALVDGAHAPGHLHLNLEELGADFYVGNIHKWLFAPRGCAIMWVHPKHHDNTNPLVVSHNHMLKTLVDRFVPSATRDSSAYLAVPAALEFHHALGGLGVIQERNSDLATAASKMLSEAWGSEEYPIPLDLRAPFMALVAMPQVFQDHFPPDEDSCNKLMKRMHEKGIFLCVTNVDGKLWARLSAHVWNSMEDFIVVRDTVLEMAKEVPSVVNGGLV